MFKKILVLFVVMLLGGCFVKLTPQQYALLPVNDNPEVISSEEVKNILPAFAVVEEGDLKCVPLGLVKRKHNAPWCFSGVYAGKNGAYNLTASDLLYPMNRTSYDHSLALAKEMSGYAFGIANVLSNIEGKPDFVVNIFIDENKKIWLYNTSNCQWLEPHEVNAIRIL